MAAKDNKGQVLSRGDPVRFVLDLPRIRKGEIGTVTHVWDDDDVEFVTKSGVKMAYRPAVAVKIGWDEVFRNVRPVSRDKVVDNALAYVANGDWDNLDQAYRDRAVAAGQAGRFGEMAEWVAKSHALHRLDRFAPSVLNWSAFKDFAVGDTVEAIREKVHRKGVKGTVTAMRPGVLTVRWSDDGFTASYGIEGNFRNLSVPKKPDGEEKLREELAKSGYGRDPSSARQYLTAHRRSITSKYGRDVYDKVFFSF